MVAFQDLDAYKKSALLLSTFPVEVSRLVLTHLDPEDVEFLIQDIVYMKQMKDFKEEIEELIGKLFYFLYGDKLKSFRGVSDIVFSIEKNKVTLAPKIAIYIDFILHGKA